MRNYIYNWYIKWYYEKYNYKIIDVDRISREVDPPFSKIEYDKCFRQPLVNEWNIIMSLTSYYSRKYHSLKRVLMFIRNISTKFYFKLERYWVKKNNLMDRVDKYIFEKLLPYVREDINSLSKEDLITYIYVSEKYTKEQIDALGFGPAPNKKIGFFKKIWHKLTFTVY